MSRVGKQPVPVPQGAEVAVSGRTVTIKGGSSELSMEYRPEVEVRHDSESNALIVERKGNDRRSRALNGTTRALLANMFTGVTEGFSRGLEVTGVGWSARVSGDTVELDVGFADTKSVPIPEGVLVAVDGNQIKVSGPDKQRVGQAAARIRQARPPEPYNGKGIRYSDEQVIRKEGKAFAGGGA